MSGLAGSGPAPGFQKRPDYEVRIDHLGARVVLAADGVKIASSAGALVVQETGHAPVLYIPMADFKSRFLSPADRRTYCPFKGEASYYSLTVRGLTIDYAFWVYETPYNETAEIAGYLGVYANLLEVTIDSQPVDLTSRTWLEELGAFDRDYLLR